MLMNLDEEKLAKLSKGDTLCLRAYFKALETAKEYQDKIDKHENPEHWSYKIFSQIKETNENHANNLLNILSELSIIKDAMMIKNPLIIMKH